LPPLSVRELAPVMFDGGITFFIHATEQEERQTGKRACRKRKRKQAFAVRKSEVLPTPLGAPGSSPAKTVATPPKTAEEKKDAREEPGWGLAFPGKER